MEAGEIDACVRSINSKLPQLTTPMSRNFTILRIPERLRLGENDAYEPRIISFGPYHHDKERLQAMQKHKWLYLQAILSRNRNITLEQYVSMIKGREDEAKACYSEHFKLHGRDFGEMMLLDGCFIVEYLLRLHERLEDELNSMVWAHSLIQYDILLLENQIPFFIVDCIFNLAFTPISSSTNAHSWPSSFMDLATMYLKQIEKMVNLPPPDSVHHLLHLYHTLLVPQSEEESTIEIGDTSLSDNYITEESTIEIGDTSLSDNYITPRINEEEFHNITIPSATVLQEAGIKFIPNKEGSSLDVTFSEGKMRIPPLLIDSFTKSKFRNLIAFEQYYPNFDKKFSKSFSAFAEFMDCIVNTSEDVALLYQKAIIHHRFSSDDNVANLLNNLNRGTFVKSDHYLAPLYWEVHEYRQKRRHKWRASLMHNYFNNPWAVVSVVAGSILLLLTFLQTYFSGYSTFDSKP